MELATVSIPPPARFERLPEMVELVIFKVVPTSERIPPPEPAVPSAILLEMVAFEMFNVPLFKL